MRRSRRSSRPNPSLVKFVLTVSTQTFAVLGISEEIAMKASFHLVAGPAVAVLSIGLLLCGPSSIAMSQTVTPSGATTSLPNVVVEAPRQVARPQKPKPHAVAASSRTSPTAATPSASPMSPAAQLAKLEKIANAAGSCVDGCVTSFRSGNAPWRGCSGSGWPALSSTCRNVGHYKSYTECTEAGLVTGWRVMETTWYCSSLALK